MNFWEQDGPAGPVCMCMTSRARGETPSWIREMHADVWDYSGSGIILYNIHDEVIVLPSKQLLGPNEMQFTYTENGIRTLGLSGSISYEMVFDITEPLEGTDVLATYTLDLTEKKGKPCFDPMVWKIRFLQSS